MKNFYREEDDMYAVITPSGSIFSYKNWLDAVRMFESLEDQENACIIGLSDPVVPKGNMVGGYNSTRYLKGNPDTAEEFVTE